MVRLPIRHCAAFQLDVEPAMAGGGDVAVGAAHRTVRGIDSGEQQGRLPRGDLKETSGLDSSPT